MARSTKGKAGRAVATRKKASWMHGSPMAWVSMALGLIGLGSTFYQWVMTYADIRAQISVLQLDMPRNYKEDNDHRDRTTKAIERIDTTIGSMAQLNVKISVLETQLTNIGEILKRMERQLETRPLPDAMDMPHIRRK